MSLITHCKLDGNAEDEMYQRDGSPSNIVWTDGKLNQAGTFNGANSIINYGTGENFFPLPNFSISVWFKSSGTTPTTGTSPALFGFTYGIRLMVKNDKLDFGLDNGSSFTYVSSPSAYNFHTDNQWHHVVVTASATQRNMYIDGEHVGSRNDSWLGTTRWATNGWNLGRDNNNSMYYFTGLIDDFRIYDNVLSAREVKELAKAKILHYKFDNFVEPTYNLLSDGLNGYSAFNLSNWNGDGAFTEVGTSEFNTPIFRYDTTGSSYRYTHDYILDDNFGDVSGQETTFSLYIRRLGGSATGRIRIYDNISGYSYQSINVDVSFKKFSMTKTMGVNPTRVFVMIDSTGGGVYEFHSTQLEVKKYATPFVNGTRGDNAITDSSGQGNDGIIETNAIPTWENDSAIGTGSYYFYQDRVIYKNRHYAKDELTIMCWVKLDEIRESGFIQSDFYLSADSTGHLRAYWYSTSNAGYHVSPNVLPTNEWTHVCATWTGTECILYEDGVEVKRVLTNTPGQDTVGYVAIGTEGDNNPPTSSRQIHGNITDVRIYTESLSENEIKELYQQRASIDNIGNFNAHELVENVEETANEFYQNWDTFLTNVGYDGAGTIQSGAIDPFGGINYKVYRLTGRARFGVTNGTDIGTLYYGNTYTFSIYLRKVAGTIEPTTTEFDICDRNDSNNYGGDLAGSLDYHWKRFYVTAYHDNSANYHFIDLGHYQTSEVIEWACPQLERKDHMTPFIDSVRSDTMLPDNFQFGKNTLLPSGIQGTESISEVGVTDGLVAYYPLDGTADDYSGNNNDATSSSITFQDGIVDKARVTGSATVPSDTAFNVKGDMTLSFWFRPDVSGARRVVMQTAYAGSFCINHETEGDLRFYNGNNSSYQSLDSSVLTNGEWYYCVAVRDDFARRWYLNGQLDTNDVTSYDGGTRVDNLTIANGYTGNEIVGALDEVRIYNRALTEAEILINYKMTSPNNKERIIKKDNEMFTKGEISEVNI